MPILIRHSGLSLSPRRSRTPRSSRARSRRHVAEDPSLAAGYRKLLCGVLIWGNVPWIIMGLGCLVGGVPSVFHYARPRDGNPFVWAFFASGLLILALGTYWLFAAGGAEMIIRHPGLVEHRTSEPLVDQVPVVPLPGQRYRGGNHLAGRGYPRPRDGADNRDLTRRCSGPACRRAADLWR